MNMGIGIVECLKDMLFALMSIFHISQMIKNETILDCI